MNTAKNASISGATGRVKEFVRSERGSSKPAPKNSSTSKQESSAKKGVNKATAAAASVQGSKHAASATSQASGKSSTSQSSGKSSAASKASSSAAASAAGSKMGGSGKGSANSALAQGAAVGTATTMGSVKPLIHDVFISKSKYPESALHIQDAINKGKPNILTIDRAGAKERRRAALQGTETKPGYDRDEYPPAMFKEGGKNASVKHISPSDNRGSGKCIGSQCKNLNNGDKIKITIGD